MTERALPVVLSGPIVRRAQDDAIWIWLATSVDLKLEAGCFDEKSLFNRYIGFGTSQSICVGKSCFVHLIEIRSLATSFPRQKRIYYDIRVGVESAASTVAKGWSLETWVPLATIVSDNRADPLPYLVLSAAEPSKKNPLNAFFSSCRKAGGKGRDSACRVADILKMEMNSSHGFHLNLMIGDQLYADDVDPVVHEIVALLAPLLIGRSEAVAFKQRDIELIFSGLTDSSLRERFLARAGFTSETLNAHCLLFGEFVALYCLSFASAALDAEFVTPKLLELGGTVHDVNLRERLERWLEGKRDLRFIWAHIPTYFLPDDHEVTDDWNIDEKWRAKSPTSSERRKKLPDSALRDTYVIPAALTSFFLFEGWGNDPRSEQCSPSSIAVLAEKLSKYLTADKVRNFPVEHTSAWHWDYLTPTVPPFVMLDTRTYRIDPKRGGQVLSWVNNASAIPELTWSSADSSSVLLGEVGARFLRDHIAYAHKVFKSACFIVSPCAFFSADAARTARRVSSVLTSDAEDWVSSDLFSMHAIAESLYRNRVPMVYLFAGDVHYGYKSEGRIVWQGSEYSIKFSENVSSPSLNASVLPKMGSRRRYETRIARWYLCEDGVSRGACDELIDAGIEMYGLPTVLVESSRVEEPVFRNNVGSIRIGTSVRVALHAV